MALRTAWVKKQKDLHKLRIPIGKYDKRKTEKGRAAVNVLGMEH